MTGNMMNGTCATHPSVGIYEERVERIWKVFRRKRQVIVGFRCTECGSEYRSPSARPAQ